MSVYFVNATPETETELKDDEQQRDSQSPVQSEALASLNAFWPKVMEDIKKINYLDLKQQALPLARIKKIMKLDEDVKMISAEAPMLFAKAAEIFIYELTLRAWIHTEDNKRRTLQRNDIAMAITKFDQFDFLIDIVPRDEIKSSKPREDGTVRTSMNPDQVHYYFQLAQQHQQALQQTATTQSIAGAHPIQIVQPQQLQTIAVNSIDQTTATNSTGSSPPQVLIQQSTNNTAATASPQNGNIQIIQQVITPSGEVQQIPIQLTQQQLQMIRMQVQGANTNQPIIIQAAPIQTANAQTPQLIQVSQQANSGPVFLTHANSNATTEPE